MHSEILLSESKAIATLPRVAGIYSITNLIDGKKYVGQSVQIYQRWSQHRTDTFNKNRTLYNHPLYKAIRKYGLKNFKCEIIEVINAKDNVGKLLSEAEIKWIKYYDCYISNGKGYNLTYGGEGTTTLIVSEQLAEQLINLHEKGETLYSISKIVDLSEPTLRKIYKDLGCSFKKNTTEIDEKISSLYLAGNSYSDIERITGYSRGGIQRSLKRSNTEARHQSNHHPERKKWVNRKKFEQVGQEIIEKYLNGYSGRNLAKEYHINRASILIYLKENNIEVKTGNHGKLNKSVKMIDPITKETIKIFSSILAATKAVGLNSTQTISCVCNKTHDYNKTAAGYLWEFVN